MAETYLQPIKVVCHKHVTIHAHESSQQAYKRHCSVSCGVQQILMCQGQDLRPSLGVGLEDLAKQGYPKLDLTHGWLCTRAFTVTVFSQESSRSQINSFFQSTPYLPLYDLPSHVF